MAGRKSKLTADLQAKIVKLIRQGNYAETACNAVGISDVTYYNWLKWGEKEPDSIYFSFFKAIKEAESKSEAEYLELIKKAAPTSWQAAAWIMERKWWKKWGRKDKIQMTTEEPLQIKVTLDGEKD